MGKKIIGAFLIGVIAIIWLAVLICAVLSVHLFIKGDFLYGTATASVVILNIATAIRVWKGGMSHEQS